MPGGVLNNQTDALALIGGLFTNLLLPVRVSPAYTLSNPTISSLHTSAHRLHRARWYSRSNGMLQCMPRLSRVPLG